MALRTGRGGMDGQMGRLESGGWLTARLTQLLLVTLLKQSMSCQHHTRHGTAHHTRRPEHSRAAQSRPGRTFR